MSDKSYNGWSNYPTWCVKLWMDNDEGSYLHWQERAQTLLETSSARWDFESDRDAARAALAEEVQESHEAFVEDLGLCSAERVGFVGDLLQAALGDVDWREIADSLLEGVMEPTP